MKRIVFLVACIVLIGSQAYADNIKVDEFYTFALGSDDIWIASTKGLVRWNQHKGVKEYYTEPGNLLVDSRIEAMVVDHSGVKWIGTDKGLIRFDGKEWSVFTSEYSPENDLKYNSVGSLAVDSNNTLWVGAHLGLSSFDGSEWRIHFPVDVSTLSSVNNISIYDENTLWITESTGVWKYRYHEDKWTLYDENDGVKTRNFVDLVVDLDNMPWFSCYDIGDQGALHDYLQHFDGNKFTVIMSDGYFTSSPFHTLFIDSDDENKGIWYDRSKYLVYFDGEQENRYPYPLPDEALTGWNITAMDKDANGIMWMITAGRGGGFYSFDGAEFTHHEIVLENVSVDELPEELPAVSVYPNPFNPVTWITFDLASPGHVSLTIYDITGAAVKTLIDGDLGAGTHEKVFDGSGMAAGMYFYRLEEGNGGVRTGKMMLVK